MIRAATIWSRALDIVFPPRCVGCREFGAFICDACMTEAPRAEGERCERCWTPGRTEACRACYQHPPAFRATRSVFVFTGTARAAVLALKFGGVSALAPTMAAPMNEALDRWSPPVDLVVPVPLGGLRARTRGYNQARLLAREVARLSGLPFEPSCVRRRTNTPAQSQQPDADARRKNIDNAFEPGRKRPSGRVLLIDDVTTTGSTLDACARALLDGGAKDVYCLTFAREDGRHSE